MNNPLATTDRRPTQALHHQSTRFGTRDLLTGMLLSSIAFASQPIVGWGAAAWMTCAALALVMGWGLLAIIGSIAALSLACHQAAPVPAAIVCVAISMVIAFGPLAVHKFSQSFTQ